MLEFVDSGMYFVRDENYFINPLLQVGSGSGSAEKSTGSGGPKISGSGSSSLLYTGCLLYCVQFCHAVFSMPIGIHILASIYKYASKFSLLKIPLYKDKNVFLLIKSVVFFCRDPES